MLGSLVKHVWSRSSLDDSHTRKIRVSKDCGAYSYELMGLLLGGSLVVRSGVISPMIGIMDTVVRLVTTHEPLST